MKTHKPIKWEDIKIGQDYCTEQRLYIRITKLADLKIRLHMNDGKFKDVDIDTISKCKHYLWEDRVKPKGNCKHCKTIDQWAKHLAESPDEMTKREYWLLTEIFVYLHDGRDYCDGE